MGDLLWHINRLNTLTFTMETCMIKFYMNSEYPCKAEGHGAFGHWTGVSNHCKADILCAEGEGMAQEINCASRRRSGKSNLATSRTDLCQES